ncbi:MmcQ/YjbR family DNA-binding protein [Streptomyces acidiscabies]|uniref:MmcQ/YjbR family DNA-binding protein n=1 Tax=Streptomyces acidiscabies TaxID=42234 RepID=A0AAP6BBW8_9ACTN|nr:MmcQ/YjbR family DNA-binding protein [Streptomyces acidiscabies]MBP5942713.1 MmcQ/YjbR family DNA-binding protein [Streptomyces sp. LBUM 1476]MBZ3917946.1 MmcQ/YjbR family DNA-binding protein [Streptomyces acidiscabies]MDX2961918.1 MmcQ/YjbR family DNA-binding protein [Streptomyces acidiscabies]MDX3021802.1 MmcQ/YjbR family DNA-binding protein [Streptomyces acidiscabies]MDX3789459.1 MmcQ/YjbR family DNA-binding protein [Streptomyces acidiscabies]
MDGAEVQRLAAQYAEGLPGTVLEHPFGPEWDVHKVRGKVFMLVTEVTGEPMVILKSAPDDAVALRAQYAEITPGYHMNKKHWITLHGGVLDEGLVEELVTDSYRLVVDRLPRAQRPVDPGAGGGR